MMTTLNFAVLTISDRCSSGETEDKSGPAIREILHNHSPNFIVVKEDCVPDDSELIEEKLREWSKHGSLINIVLTTGGTGFGPRDVTPEATRNVVDRLCPAISTAMTISSLHVTPMAMLSRSVSGIRNGTLIVNLPGSVKSASECVLTVLPCFSHASDLLRDAKESIEKTHSTMHEPPKSEVSGFDVTKRNRVSPWSMLSMDEATALVMGSVPPAQESISIPVSDALGFVISNHVQSTDNLPPFRASVKDGYAVIASNGAGDFRVLSALTAGCSPVGLPSLRANECIRVNTGGPVPSGADAVVQVEDTQLVEADTAGNELVVRVLVPPKVGQDIRPIGCDIKESELVLSEGTEIRSAEAGILAAVGVTTVSVYRKPAVALLSTGNELVPAGEKLVPGVVRDSNMTTLRSLLSENGFPARDMGIAKDQPDVLLMELKRCLNVADVVITTGSVSMGEKDHLKDVLIHDLGAEILFGRVHMKPGKPTTFAKIAFNGKTKFLFALPGNPASATVMTHLLVLPALKKMSGHTSPLPTQVLVKLDFDVKLDPDRPEYRRVIVSFDKTGRLVARSTGSQASSRLLSWRAANALLILPPGDVLQRGSQVQALILNRI